MKEQELIALIKTNNSSGPEILLSQYRPLIKYILTPIVKKEEDREECIQDIVLKICSKIDSYEPEKGSLNAWITAIARNTALNKIRALKSAENTVSLENEASADIPSSEPTPEEALLKKEKRAALARAINSLQTQDKTIFYRKFYYMQSHAQIAAELGLTERAVEGRLYRIRKQLKEKLGGELND